MDFCWDLCALLRRLKATARFSVGRNYQTHTVESKVLLQRHLTLYLHAHFISSAPLSSAKEYVPWKLPQQHTVWLWCSQSPRHTATAECRAPAGLLMHLLIHEAACEPRCSTALELGLFCTFFFFLFFSFFAHFVKEITEKEASLVMPGRNDKWVPKQAFLGCKQLTQPPGEMPSTKIQISGCCCSCLFFHDSHYTPQYHELTFSSPFL